MPSERGQYIPLSLPRKWIGDLLYFSSRVPLVSGERALRVRSLATARKSTRPTFGWNTLITKGVALVSQRIPALRQIYMPYPWPRFFQSPYSVASILVDRDYLGEHAVFMAPMLYPEELTLAAIQAKLQRFKTAPIESISPFRRLIRTTRFPRPIRRTLWRIGMQGAGLLRARTFGTFGINSVAGQRIQVRQVISPITSTFYYESVSASGLMPVQLAFDHRVYDGYTAGRIFSELESVLNNEILDEVKKTEPNRVAA